MRAVIFLLPCGCFASFDTIHLHSPLSAGKRHFVAECPWCSATWDAERFLVWLRGRGHEVLFSTTRPPGKLFRFGRHTCEVVRPCACGDSIVREVNRTPVNFHFDVPQEEVEILRN